MNELALQMVADLFPEIANMPLPEKKKALEAEIAQREQNGDNGLQTMMLKEAVDSLAILS